MAIAASPEGLEHLYAPKSIKKQNPTKNKKSNPIVDFESENKQYIRELSERRSNIYSGARVFNEKSNDALLEMP